MGRTVAYIIGASYSGSSLLNLLLDSQPGVRGLGEAIQLFAGSGNARCGLCGKSVRECPSHAAMDRNRFYGSLFDFYGDCDTLIDSSKSVAACLGAHPFEPDLEHRVLLLSKAPHEFAHSWIGHHPDSTPESCIQNYLDHYERQISLLSRLSWFTPWRCMRVTYRQLATRTDAALERICEFLGISQNTGRPPWSTDTHIIGGNWMVAAQVSGRRGLFTEADWYLKGKYIGNYHKIFYDDQWSKDRAFVSRCLDVYRLKEGAIREMLGDLDQLDYRQQVTELRALL